MDLTFGKNGNYCGVLIRSIYDTERDELIEGPCKVVDKIVAKENAVSIKNLVVDKWKNNLSATKLFVKNKDDDDKIYTSPRVGLTLKKDIDERIDYVAKSYRYFVVPSLKKNSKVFKLLYCYHHADITTATKKELKISKKFYEDFEENWKDLAKQSRQELIEKYTETPMTIPNAQDLFLIAISLN